MGSETARQIAQGVVADIMVAAEEGYGETRDAKDLLLDGWTRTIQDALERETAHALVQAAAQEARAEGLEGALRDIVRLQEETYGDATELHIELPWLTVTANSLLSAPRPEPGRLLEVVRAAIQVVEDWDATADALERGRDESASPEERSLALAVDNLTPEERAALGEDTP